MNIQRFPLIKSQFRNVKISNISKLSSKSVQPQNISRSKSDIMRKNSIKNTRINGEVRKELSIIISSKIKDPRIHPMTSVVDVEVTPDLKFCKAYISVLGDEQVQKSTMEGLNSAMGFIRKELAHSVNLRNTPAITFIMDQSIEYGVNMSKKIDDLTKNLKKELEIKDI